MQKQMKHSKLTPIEDRTRDLKMRPYLMRFCNKKVQNLKKNCFIKIVCYIAFSSQFSDRAIFLFHLLFPVNNKEVYFSSVQFSCQTIMLYTLLVGTWQLKLRSGCGAQNEHTTLLPVQVGSKREFKIIQPIHFSC